MLICIFFVIYFYIYIYLFTLFYGISFFGTLIVFSLQKKITSIWIIWKKKNFFFPKPLRLFSWTQALVYLGLPNSGAKKIKVFQ